MAVAALARREVNRCAHPAGSGGGRASRLLPETSRRGPTCAAFDALRHARARTVNQHSARRDLGGASASCWKTLNDPHHPREAQNLPVYQMFLTRSASARDVVTGDTLRSPAPRAGFRLVLTATSCARSRHRVRALRREDGFPTKSSRSCPPQRLPDQQTPALRPRCASRSDSRLDLIEPPELRAPRSRSGLGCVRGPPPVRS